MTRALHLLDGRVPRPGEWATLDLPARRADPGPSPAGNPGPYWLVPDAEGATRRVYCRRVPCPDGCHR